MLNEAKASTRGFSLEKKLAFYSMPEPNTGCWLWFGAMTSKGYGQLRYGDARLQAHRAAYEAEHNISIDPELVVDHRCRNRACVNPQHLEVVTQKINTRRGYWTHSNLPIAEFCANGHRFTEVGVYIGKTGHRRCRICCLQSHKEWNALCD